MSATMSASPATLASATLPTRVRNILEALKALLWQSLEAPLQSTLAELERVLFDQAERARNSQLQQGVYQELQGRRAPRALRAVLQGATGSGPGHAAAAARQARPAAPGQDQPGDADADPGRRRGHRTRHRAARYHPARSGTGQPPLQLLGQRFGVLAARPAFEAEHTPLGPHLLCRILRGAGEELQLGLNAQLTLYRAFECQGLVRYGEIVERANVLLAHAVVLHGLVYLPYVVRPTSAPDPATGKYVRRGRHPPCTRPPAGRGRRHRAAGPGRIPVRQPAPRPRRMRCQPRWRRGPRIAPPRQRQRRRALPATHRPSLPHCANCSRPPAAAASDVAIHAGAAVPTASLLQVLG